MSLEPAKSIVARLGGIDATALVAGVHKSRVYHWMGSKEAGGTGGSIPQRHIPAILRYAKEIGLEMTYADFFEIAAEQGTELNDLNTEHADTCTSELAVRPDAARAPAALSGNPATSAPETNVEHKKRSA